MGCWNTLDAIVRISRAEWLTPRERPWLPI